MVKSYLFLKEFFGTPFIKETNIIQQKQWRNPTFYFARNPTDYEGGDADIEDVGNEIQEKNINDESISQSKEARCKTNQQFKVLQGTLGKFNSHKFWLSKHKLQISPETK